MREPARTRTRGAWSERDPRWTARRRARQSTSGGARIAGVLFALSVTLFLIVHALTLASAPAPAGRTLRAILPALTDLDQALAAHRDDIAATAAGSASTPLPGLPFAVEVPSASVMAGGAELRRAALDRIIAVVYAEGTETFRSPDAPPGGPSAFSAQWSVRQAIGVLTRAAHDRLIVVRWGVAALAALLALLLATRVDRRRLPLAVGSAVVAGAALAALTAGVGRGLIWLFASGSGVAGAVVARVAHDLMMTMLATALLAAVAGLLMAAVGTVVMRLLGDDAPRRVVRQRGERVGADADMWEDV